MMAKEDLKPVRTKEEAKERGKNGGKKSGEKRRQQRTFREIFKAILATNLPANADLGATAAKIQELFGVKTYDEALSYAMMFRALNGDTKAFEIVRDTIGEKPQDNVKMEIEKVVIADDL